MERLSNLFRERSMRAVDSLARRMSELRCRVLRLSSEFYGWLWVALFRQKNPSHIESTLFESTISLG